MSQLSTNSIQYKLASTLAKAIVNSFYYVNNYGATVSAIKMINRGYTPDYNFRLALSILIKDEMADEATRIADTCRADNVQNNMMMKNFISHCIRITKDLGDIL